MTATETTKSRMEAELAELEKLVAAAPPEHPAKIACSKIAGFLPVASDFWFELHHEWPVRTLANEVAKGTVPGICKSPSSWMAP